MDHSRSRAFVNVFAKPKVDGKRRAFLLANSNYITLRQLSNPRNDIDAVKKNLAGLHFKVEDFSDLDHKNLNARVDEFIKELDKTETTDVVFYYSGHGIQLVDQNYVVPVDYSLEYNLAGLFNIQEDFLRRVSPKVKNKFVFLDACRDSGGLSRALLTQYQTLHVPDQLDLTGSINRPSSQAVAASRSSIAQPSQRRAVTHQTTNTFIAFSADQDDVALDGRGNMSPFSSSVVENLGLRGLDIFDLSQRVARTVRKNTKTGEWAQIPWVHSNFSSSYYFNPPSRIPLFALAAWGALAGVIHFMVAFKAFGNGHLKSLSVNATPLLTSLTLAFGLGFAAWYWGTPREWMKRWSVPRWVIWPATMAVAFAFFAVSRLWFEDLGPWSVYERLKSLTFESLLSKAEAAGAMRELLYVITLPTTLAGAGAAISGALFVKQLARPGPICAAALSGFGASACFVIFVLIQKWLSADPISENPYLWQLILLLVVAWETVLASVIGWGYARHRPRVDD